MSEDGPDYTATVEELAEVWANMPKHETDAGLIWVRPDQVNWDPGAIVRWRKWVMERAEALGLFDQESK